MNKMPIKVCFVIDALHIGGTEKQLIETIRNMNPAKVKCYLVCLRNSEMFENIDINCKKLLLDVRRLKSISILKKILYFKSFLIKEKIDIVQTFFIDANIFGVITAKLAGVERIISCRRDMGFWYNNKKLAYLMFVNRFVTRFLVNSESIKKNIINFEKIPEDKIDVIYNGINLSYFEDFKDHKTIELKRIFNIPEGHIVIGCVSTLDRKVKRVDLFIKASAIVCQAAKNVKFLIVGDGYLRNELVGLASTLNLQDRIIFTGERSDIVSILKVMDIGVLASDSEGFSNSIIEYMAAGIPTVATDVGGNRELIDNNIDGFLVPPDNPELLASAILKLVNDEKLRVTMGNNSKQKIYQKFSLDKMIKNLENYYSNMLNC